MNDTNRIADRSDHAARRERIIPPDTIQTSNAIRHAAAGSAIQWANITQIPTYSSSDNDITAEVYIVLPADDTTPVWSNGGGGEVEGDYAENDVVKGSNDRIYKCVLQAGSGTHDPTEDTTDTYWTIDDANETQIDHVLGYAGTQDMRDFVPWLEVGTLVPIVEKSDVWYIALQFTRVGASGDRTVIWNETDERAMAVWK